MPYARLKKIIREAMAAITALVRPRPEGTQLTMNDLFADEGSIEGQPNGSENAKFDGQEKLRTDRRPD